MPITPCLQERAFEPEVVSAMGLALEKTRERLKLSASRADPLAQLFASRIIEVAAWGERDPEVLCRHALQEFYVENEPLGGTLRLIGCAPPLVPDC